MNKNIKQLFIIGSQKSGTTYLANLLLQHPRVALLQGKEPDFFSGQWSRGFNWYHQNVDDLDKVYLDASTSYSAAPVSEPEVSQFQHANDPFSNVPERIADNVEKPYFIYILRDPVKRAYASYWHQVRAGLENRDFMSAIKQDSFYLRQGKYLEQLKLYLNRFNEQQILVITFEQFITNPTETSNQCFNFINLEPMTVEVSQNGQNKSFTYSGLLGMLNHRLGKYGGVNNFIRMIKPLVPRPLFQFAGSLLTTTIPRMKEHEKSYLQNYYSMVNDELAEKFQLDISQWT